MSQISRHEVEIKSAPLVVGEASKTMSLETDALMEKVGKKRWRVLVSPYCAQPI